MNTSLIYCFAENIAF